MVGCSLPSGWVRSKGFDSYLIEKGELVSRKRVSAILGSVLIVLVLVIGYAAWAEEEVPPPSFVDENGRVMMENLPATLPVVDAQGNIIGEVDSRSIFPLRPGGPIGPDIEPGEDVINTYGQLYDANLRGVGDIVEQEDVTP